MKLPFGAVLLLLTLACGAAAAEDTAPNKPSRDWKRYVLDDLEAVGNASEKELRRAVEEVHRFRGTLLALMPGLNTRSPERTIGKRDEARKHFSWVKERGDRNYTEYELAVAELKRLDRP